MLVEARHRDDAGTIEAEFTYVPQPYAQLVSQRREGESLFHHFDGLRDTRELSDAAGVVTDEYQYDAWGELKSSTGSTANSHTFKGELLAYRDDPRTGPEQSIYPLHYRDYVSSQGRLRSEDPAEDDLNLYRYCHNDPVNRSDPSGLEDSSAILRERRLRHVTLGELDGWMEALSNKQIRSLKEAALAYAPPTNVARTYSNIRSLVEYHIGGGNQPELTVEELHDVFRAWNLIRWHDPIDWENPLQAFHLRRLSNGNYALTITPQKQPNISLEDARRDVLFQLIRLDAESLASYVEREQGLRHGIAGRVDRILAERAGRTALDVAGVVAEPVDWINTGVGIAEEPANPGSYVGLLPFVPGGARRARKKVDEAEDPTQFAEFIDEPSNLPGSGKPPSKRAATPRTVVPNKVLSKLQGEFDELAKVHLIPKYKKLDSDLKWGYTGSFKTGKVGNRSKPTFGEPIDLSNFDVDVWIESDILYKKFGSNLRADVEFRKLLSETAGFEGLKPNKQGFSIKFKPSTSN